MLLPYFLFCNYINEKYQEDINGSFPNLEETYKIGDIEYRISFRGKNILYLTTEYISDRRKIDSSNGGWSCLNPGPHENQVALGIGNKVFDVISEKNPDMPNIEFIGIKRHGRSDLTGSITFRILDDSQLSNEINEDVDILKRMVYITPSSRDLNQAVMGGLDFGVFN